MRSGFGPRLKALAGLTAPVGVALLLVSFLGGTEPASPPYGTQRVDFAVLWGTGITLNPASGRYLPLLTYLVRVA